MVHSPQPPGRWRMIARMKGELRQQLKRAKMSGIDLFKRIH
jgi:hypothetical protein